MAEEPPNTETESAETSAAEPEPSKWLRVRPSSLLNVDKIGRVSIQRRDDSIFLHFAADRSVYVPVPDLASAKKALDAIAAGETDIARFTVSRSFMEEG